jgi:hypothetical protein
MDETEKIRQLTPKIETQENVPCMLKRRTAELPSAAVSADLDVSRPAGQVPTQTRSNTYHHPEKETGKDIHLHAPNIPLPLLAPNLSLDPHRSTPRTT